MSENNKILEEERDKIRDDLKTKREECFDLENLIKEHINDQASIHNILEKGDGKKKGGDQSNAKIQQ